ITPTKNSRASWPNVARASRRRSSRSSKRIRGTSTSMRGARFALAAVLLLWAVAGGVFARAGQQGRGQAPSQFPLSNAIRERGSSITGAYEGWYRNRDGTINLLVGYFNRNTKQELDIPVGPQNQIEPGGPDQGQPTHFLTGRQWGVFSIKVPKDLGDQKLTW